MKKTIEEAAREYADAYTGIRYKDVCDAFNAGAEFTLANQWINAGDELPKHGHLVLITDRDGDVYTARYNEILECFKADNCNMAWSRTSIDHWMPIPEPKTKDI